MKPVYFEYYFALLSLVMTLFGTLLELTTCHSSDRPSASIKRLGVCNSPLGVLDDTM